MYVSGFWHIHAKTPRGIVVNSNKDSKVLFVKEHLRTAIWRDIIISLRKRRFNSADGDKEEKNMTVKECYEQMGADYEGVLGRLRSEVLIKKFAKKFLDDGSFRSLKDNLVQKNGKKLFVQLIP